MNPSNKKSITAAEVLMSEAEAIASAARRIDQVSIEKIIHMLEDCKSKIVFSGVGKSGIVAKKISATFNSVDAPLLLTTTTKSPAATKPKSPCRASNGFKNTDIRPTELKVAEIFFATIPDFPTPLKTILDLQSSNI